MKKLKTLLALLLALAMMLSFVACGDSSSTDNDDDDDVKTEEKDNEDKKEEDKKEDKKEEDKKEEEEVVSIVGTWKGDIDLSKLLNQVFSTALGIEGNTIKEFKLPMTMVLKADNKYEVSIDKAEFDKNADKIVDDVYNAVVTMVDKMIQQQYGTTLDAFLQSQNMTMEALMQQSGVTKDSLKQNITESMQDGFETVSGNYEVKDGKLYMEEEGNTDTDGSDEYYTIKKLTKTTLELQLETKDEEMKEVLGEGFVIVLNRA